MSQEELRNQICKLESENQQLWDWLWNAMARLSWIQELSSEKKIDVLHHFKELPDKELVSRHRSLPETEVVIINGTKE